MRYVRYIRLFRESNKDEYYTYLNRFVSFEGLKIVDISRGNIDYIRNLIGVGRYSIEISTHNFKAIYSNRDFIQIRVPNTGIDIESRNFTMFHNGIRNIKIHELEDEWFIVELDYAVFKCDQIDGVRELLVDKNIIEG